jgi:hypothetical protein
VGAVGSLEGPVVLGTPRGREELGHNRLEHGRLTRTWPTESPRR